MAANCGASSASNGLKMRVRVELKKRLKFWIFSHLERNKLKQKSFLNIFKEKDKFRAEFAENRNLHAKGMRKSPLSALDEPLARWVKFVRENKVPLTGDIIQQKAMDFAKVLGLNDISASQEWLCRFKARHNLWG